ncbi:MAG: hypothetical protein LBE82_12760, partial [Chitinophagaceae bacterium]|nr:hypothetical protein [Chitinophagaceae bacterium]
MINKSFIKASMYYTFKTKAKYIQLILLGVFALLLSVSKTFAQKDTTIAAKDSFVNYVGTIIPETWANSISNRMPDYILHLGDSTLIYAEYISKDSLDAPVEYSADDSAIMLIQQKEIFLHGKGNVKHKDVTIDANTIHYTQDNNLVKAWGGTDTSKHALNLPTITQGDAKMIMDTITFNLKNQKGIMKNAHYNEGEIFVAA